MTLGPYGKSLQMLTRILHDNEFNKLDRAQKQHLMNSLQSVIEFEATIDHYVPAAEILVATRVRNLDTQLFAKAVAVLALAFAGYDDDEVACIVRDNQELFKVVTTVAIMLGYSLAMHDANHGGWDDLVHGEKITLN